MLTPRDKLLTNALKINVPFRADDIIERGRDLQTAEELIADLLAAGDLKISAVDSTNGTSYVWNND